MELEEILRQHAARYPLMEPTDAVKLIYQNEFGGGHLIRDPQIALEYLRREYGQTKKDPDVPLCEDIGNGIVRVNLAAVGEGKLDRIGEAFLTSAALHKGSLDSFREKLNLLRRLTSSGVFPFDSSKLDRYLADYEAAGFPMVSHSQTYREAYHPAYRIVLRHLLEE